MVAVSGHCDCPSFVYSLSHRYWIPMRHSSSLDAILLSSNVPRPRAQPSEKVFNSIWTFLHITPYKLPAAHHNGCSRACHERGSWIVSGFLERMTSSSIRPLSGEPKRRPHEGGPQWIVFRHLNDFKNKRFFMVHTSATTSRAFPHRRNPCGPGTCAH